MRFAIDIFGAALSIRNPRHFHDLFEAWSSVGVDGQHSFDDVPAFARQLSQQSPGSKDFLGDFLLVVTFVCDADVDDGDAVCA